LIKRDIKIYTNKQGTWHLQKKMGKELTKIEKGEGGVEGDRKTD
jgi:hypothetical protein